MARTGYGFAAALGLLPAAGALPAYAQSITIDGRLSPAQTLTGPNYTIGANLGQQRGANLFHSFGRFGVAANETATFTGPAGISNVIGRVTGGNPSTIAGTLRSTVVGANVTLINPAGIAVTQGARIDVPGAFRVSTADEVRFADGARFSATNPSGSTLTHAPPASFGFASPAQPITITGANITAGGIGIAGGAVTISGGTLSAPGGEIRIAGTAGAGEVKLERGGPRSTVTAWAPVRIDAGTQLDVSGVGGPAGTVRVRGSGVTISGSSTRVIADSTGTGSSRTISLRGEDTVSVTDGARVQAFARDAGSGSSIRVETAPSGSVLIDNGRLRAVSVAAGAAGDIIIESGSLTLSNGARVESLSGADGPAGTVQVRLGGDLWITGGSMLRADGFGTGASGTVDMIASGTLGVTGGGAYSFVAADSYGSGPAGRVRLHVGDLVLGDFSYITADALGAGPAGAVDIMVGRNALLSTIQDGATADVGATNYGTGIAGSVRMNVLGDLTLSARGQGTRSRIITHSHGAGAGGDVSVTVGGTLLAIGNGQTGAFSEISTTNFADGPAGAISIGAGTVALRETVFVTSDSSGVGAAGSVAVTARRDVSLVVSEPFGYLVIGANGNDQGNGGLVRVTAGGDLTLQASGQGGYTAIETQSQGAGRAGAMRLDVAGSIILDGASAAGAGARLSATAFRGGNAGSINIGAASLTLAGDARIRAENTAARGGRVGINLAGDLLFDGRGGFAAIDASNYGFGGDRPHVDIAACNVSLIDGGQIRAWTFGAGDAGQIGINASGTVRIRDVNSTFGSGGVGIQALAFVFSSGAAGDVVVNAQRLEVGRGSDISAATRGSGSAGNVRFNIDGLFILDGETAGPATVGSGTFKATGRGGPGSIIINAGEMIVRDGGEISASTTNGGAAGDVTISVRGNLLMDGPRGGAGEITSETKSWDDGFTGGGNAGRVTVNAGSLTIRDGSIISTSTRASAGAAGDVTVNVTAALEINGSNRNSRPSGIVSLATLDPPFVGASTTKNPGRAGNVTVTAGSITLGNGGEVSSSSLLARDAGDVTVTAPTVAIGPGGLIASSTTGSGRGGNVSVSGGDITIAGPGARIAASSTGTGQAGDVQVVAQNLFVRDGGSIATSAALADGGNIRILIPRSSGLLRLDRGAITASVAGGAGSGGNIFIDPFATTLNNASAIAANAFGGPGGNVSIATTYLFVSPDSSITASSALGVQGTVSVSTTPVDPAGTLATLQGDLRAASAVLREACAVRSATSVASLVVGTPGGLPFTPEGPLPSTYLAGRPLFDAAPAPWGVAQALAPATITPSVRCG